MRSNNHNKRNITIFHSFVKGPNGLISIYLILLVKCVEDATCDDLGPKNECSNGVCYDG